jgi:hypothetical protein
VVHLALAFAAKFWCLFCRMESIQPASEAATVAWLKMKPYYHRDFDYQPMWLKF